MSQKQSYFGQFTVSTDTRNLRIVNANSAGSAFVSINAGADVFITGYEGEQTNHFCDLVQASIRQQSNHTNAVCNYSPQTGRVSLYLSEDANVEWVSRELGNTLGFTERWHNGAQSYEGDKTPRYTWRPTRGLADHPLDVNAWWGQRSTSKITRSQDGTVRSIRGSILNDGAYSYRNLPRKEVVVSPQDPTSDFDSFESFWRDAIHKGAVVRVFPERENMNSSGFFDGTIVLRVRTGSAMDVGGLESYAGRSQPPWDALWDVDFDMVKNV